MVVECGNAWSWCQGSILSHDDSLALFLFVEIVQRAGIISSVIALVHHSRQGGMDCKEKKRRTARLLLSAPNSPS